MLVDVNLLFDSPSMDPEEQELLHSIASQQLYDAAIHNIQNMNANSECPAPRFMEFEESAKELQIADYLFVVHFQEAWAVQILDRKARQAALPPIDIMQSVAEGNLLSEAYYVGMSLMSLHNCAPLQILNPFSNPFYNGLQLEQQLWTNIVTNIPYIQVPFIANISNNLAFYRELIRKYYQAALNFCAAMPWYDAVDQYSIPAFRLQRKFQLLLAATKAYISLAQEVANLFITNDRPRIFAIIYFSTVLHPFKLTCALLNRIVPDSIQLDDTEGLYEILFDISNIAAQAPSILDAFTTLPDADPTFPGHSIIAADLLTIERDLKSALKKISGAGITIPSAISMREIFTSINNLRFIPYLRDDGINPAIWQQFQQLLVGLQQALLDPLMRKKILSVINATIIMKQQYIKVLHDTQLVDIYTYILKILQAPETIKYLLLLQNANDNTESSSMLITHTRSNGLLRDPLLHRTIRITRSSNGFYIYLVPNSKAACGQAFLPKFSGHIASVTAQFNITPNCSFGVDTILASKTINLGAVNSSRLKHDKQRIIRSIEIARSIGHAVKIDDIYEHVKKVISATGEVYSERRVALRCTETWMPNTLANLTYSNLTQDAVLLLDAHYNELTYTGQIEQLHNAKINIFKRIICSLLQQLQNLHEKQIIHKDLKPNNILLFIDASGLLNALITDFELSIDLKLIRKKIQPIANCHYASPQTVAFTLCTKEALDFPPLLETLQRKTDTGLYELPSFGRELYFAHQEQIASLEEPEQIQPDLKDDVFAMGIIFVELLAGCYPTCCEKLHGTTLGNRPLGALQKTLPSIHQFSELITSMLNPIRKDRCSSAEAYAIAAKIADLPCPRLVTDPKITSQAGKLCL